MDHGFWRERWHEGRIGFHRLDANPMLERFWPMMDLGSGRVLVPLCGKSVDLDWLLGRGHEVVGVEFVEAAVSAYFSERSLSPVRTEVDGFPRFEHGAITLLVADFFRVPPNVTGRVDAVYDRAAWVAIAPTDRPRYVQQIRTLARPGARVLLLNFEHDLGDGPPFSIPRDELRAHWSGFALQELYSHDILEEEPRFRERGCTRFEEQVWLGTVPS